MLLRTLPDPVPPARHEIAPSYIGRLATLHGLDTHSLWVHITQPERPGASRRIVVPERLAALTGRSIYALAGAMPELRDPPPNWEMFRHQPQAGCHLCDAKHPGGRVVRLLPHHRYVCLRHGTWIGPPDIDHPAADLSRLPEIIDAQRRHLLILRRCGWAATYDAVLTALMICAHIWNDGNLRGDVLRSWQAWDKRSSGLIPYDQKKNEYTNYSTSRLFAAVYPEAVALAPLIASSHSRLTASGTPAEQSQFLTEISNRVTYPYNDSERVDAVAHWALVDSWRPPSRPLSTYTPGQARGTIPGLHSARLTRHERSARWFNRTQRAQGRTLLFHNHLKPVLAREWTPKFVEWQGTVWHSRDISDLIQKQVTRERNTPRDDGQLFPRQRTEDARSNVKHRPGCPLHKPPSTS